MNKRRLLFIVMVGATLALPLFASAQTQATCNGNGFCALAPANNSQLLNNLYSNQNGLAGYVNAMFQLALSIGAMIAVLRLVYAGYLYMGTDMWSSKKHATDVIRDTVLGLFILLAIYLILYQIDPNILNLNVTSDITPIQTSQTTNTTGTNPAVQNAAQSSGANLLTCAAMQGAPGFCP